MASGTCPEVLLRDEPSFSAAVSPGGGGVGGEGGGAGGEGDDRVSDGGKHRRRSPTDSVMRMTACTVRPYISSPLTCSVNSFSMDDSFRRLATFSTTWSQIPAQGHSDAVNSQDAAPPPPLVPLTSSLQRSTNKDLRRRVKNKKPERVKQGCCHLVPGGDSYFVVFTT